jgi:hypothetical protein
LLIKVQNTTIGKTDEGQGKNIAESRRLIEQGFIKLHLLIETQPDDYGLALLKHLFSEPLHA